MLKFCGHIEIALENIEKTRGTYYAGGTLCLSIKGRNEVAMNIDGTGFVITNKMKNAKLYLPVRITELVRKVYLKHKGYNTYFSEVVSNEQKEMVQVLTNKF